jgi:predicted glycoside hydrolase/deacetylase ChbG (UPF0249 family)
VKVVFNADDYGSHPQISRGILQSMRKGVVRSTTVMANMVTEAELVELKKLPAISAGLHINLTKGKPLSQFPCRWLDEHGNFNPRLIFSPEGGPCLPRETVRVEAQAQLFRLMESGFKPSHVDSHHHAHGFAAVYSVSVEIATKHNLAMRPTTSWMAAELARLGIRCPQVLITGFYGKNNISRARLAEYLDAAMSARADVVEVMCHPGLASGLPAEHSSYLQEREEELAVLCSSELAAWLNDRGFEIINYAQV